LVSTACTRSADALDYFEESGKEDKQRLFTYRSASGVNLYRLDDELDYFYGFMLPETGCLQPKVGLLPYEDGLILQTPSRTIPHELRPFQPMPKLFSVFQESKQWSRILGVEDVGALNDRIADGRINELIQTSEALHSKRLAEIASEIAERKSVKLVLIAGPSSSGKTTFAQRLMVQLRAEGMTPHLISMDNYFLDRANSPVDEEGNPDYECPEALDVAQFNLDMQRLMDGEAVEIPVYNFKKGKREYNGRILRMKEHDVLIVEGIHGLNEKISYRIPRENKYKIYISALTLINIDDHNRIPTTDGRLLRRMIRDNAHRGTGAAETIAMWPSVRRGEERYIFPYQEEADRMFNSAHIYELAVLKSYAEPLLYQIQRSDPAYAEARRLIKFLSYFLSVSSEPVPNTSLIREFIGGSIFEQ
jgi:uridine kinase